MPIQGFGYATVLVFFPEGYPICDIYSAHETIRVYKYHGGFFSNNGFDRHFTTFCEFLKGQFEFYDSVINIWNNLDDSEKFAVLIKPKYNHIGGRRFKFDSM